MLSRAVVAASGTAVLHGFVRGLAAFTAIDCFTQRNHEPSANFFQQPSYVTASVAAWSFASAFSAMSENPESSAHAAPVATFPAPAPGQGSTTQRPDLLGAPPIPPPRTSSNRSRHSPPTEKGASGSRHSKHRPDDRHERRNDENRSRRQHDTTASPSEESSKRPSGSAGVRSSLPASSNPSNMETIPSQGTLVKESSTVINQVLVSDPSVDIQREQVRQSGTSESPPANKDAPPATSGGGLGLVGSEGVDDGGRGGLRSRHDYNGNSTKRKELTFGQYVLGQTLGEGEFGKVKLGWKKDGTIQVAVKLIRREVLGSNPTRLPKIYREISILRDLAHPNIVRLHEMVETDRHIGIIMEYASGGELFDHILNNRYLKDNAARRLFAQLISGVGYLHKKGIVHRDLKLENLLLDRNRNIIITDFGFANTFDPADELSEEIEYNLTNKDFVKKTRLDKPNARGMRRGDLMQTSCGSPCYAAPELVVSDSLYTGRKVDVWSCGVILYAMLAGYLPFDDDPANPDGDNINLLYKYIVTTPLTFPEYVTPHARDLLRRILVPDPRKRADLFEVARHSWLNEYSHVVSHITSSTTMVSDIANATIPLGMFLCLCLFFSYSVQRHFANSDPEQQKEPSLARSASVREPPKSYHSPVPTVGGLSHQSGDVSVEQQSDRSKTPRDAKRRTVQVEYVAPQSQTTRGDTAATSTDAPKAEGSRSSAIVSPQEESSSSKALDNTAVANPSQASGHQYTRPTTGGSMTSFNAGRLSRGSYGQPVAPTVATTNAQGRLAQPTGKQYMISAPIPQDPTHAATMSIGQPSAQQLPPKFNMTPRQDTPKGHKRSNTVSGIGEKLFGRTGSIFGGRSTQPGGSRQRASRRYPPTSMREPVTGDGTRASEDSRRSGPIGSSSRKYSEAGEGRPRRFSLLPASFSLRGFGSTSRSQTPDDDSQGSRTTHNHRPHNQPSTGAIRPRARAASHAGPESTGGMAPPEGPSDEVFTNDVPVNHEPRFDQQFASLHGRQSATYQSTAYSGASAEQMPRNEQEQYARHQHANHSAPSYFDGGEGYDNGSRQSMHGRSGVLQKNRKFADAYEYERDLAHHPGSSGAARKVMDFFRRRAKSRAGDDR